MQILTAIAAILYAVTLWLFAPSKIWENELAKAKANQLPKEEPTPEKEPETIQTPEMVKTILTPKPNTETPKPNTETVDTAAPNSINWTVAKLRKKAQQQKLNWKDENGKPLKKNELMRILAV